MGGNRGKERSAGAGEAKSLGPASVEDSDLHTVFVRNLPFFLTDSQLEDIFSEVGPVRHCFTIKEKGSDQHRGFGFVQFAVAEDAHRAVQEKNGASLQGRNIKVEIAKRRAPLDQRRPPKPDPPPNNESNTVDQQQDPKLDSGKTEQKKRKSSEVQVTSPADKGSTEQPESKKIKPDGEPKVRVQKAEQKKEEDVVPVPDEPKKGKKEKKGHKEKRSDGKAQVAVSDAETKEQEEQQGSAKQRPARTVVVGGLLNTEMFEAVLAVAKTVGPVESIQRTFSEIELHSRGLAKDGCKPRAAAIVFLSVKAANQAVAALHTKSIGGGVVWARQLGGEGSKLKSLRLIVRNLPFQITESQLRDIFTPVGFLWEVTIPRKPDGTCKGFAFVGFINRSDAEKAIKAVNGTSIGKRPVAVDWAVGKKEYETAISTAKTPAPASVIPDLDDGDTTASDSEDEMDEELDDEVELPSVANEVTAEADKKSKKKSITKEEETAKTEVADKKLKKQKLVREEAAVEEEGDMEVSVADKKTRRNKLATEEAEKQVSLDEMEKRKHAQLENMDRSEEMDMMKKILNKVVSTLHETGPPTLDDDEEEEAEEIITPVTSKVKSAHKEVVESVEANGKPSKAKKAVEPAVSEKDEDQNTFGRTVFIRNLPMDAKVPELRKMFSDFGVVKSLRMVLHPVTLRPKGTAFLEYSSKEAAEAAIAAASTNGVDMNGLMVKGRVINVSLAVDRDTARDIAKDASKKKDEEDRRNLALAKEGFIQEGTAAAEGVSKKDLQKRQMLEYEKSTKLRSPNFHVSRTRLSVHNVPKGFTEKALKKLFIEAVKSRASKQQPVIKQVKILRDEETGKARGTAFVEFTEHQHALVALRVLNNNPGTFTAENRPIVEFAVENSLILRKRAVQLEKSKSMQAAPIKQNVEERQKTADNVKKGRKSRRDEPDGKGGRGGQVEGGEIPTKSGGAKKREKKRESGKEKSVEAEGVSQDQPASTAGRKRKRDKKDALTGMAGDAGLDKKASMQAGQARPTKAGIAGQKLKGKAMNGGKDGPAMKDKLAKLAVSGKLTKSKQSKQPAGSKQSQSAKGGPAKKFASQQIQEIDEASLREKKRLKMLTKAKASESKLDKLVTEYRTKYFSDGPTSKSKTKSTGGTAGTVGDFRRWFD
ncbi:nucleolar protein 4 [Marchantia polymorpha subsp. ruderalis]|uniref:RRM domain-containing protein n=2 Tax=Marchantia polymorpha TaxID=3197 RepID=A0AAF6BZ83_MARPO|nr:hypothetical protein MARPO_0009s0044 [Marchantia polymorpha]BBN17317.1 hypothetical protein Mp_7g13580 [Marchantia polymorpha subsp. ruderalis]|eukprot:PTQ46921.1 hypothetical protein MARPO_0009s0044 [Marchantia polymorpha]